MVPERRDVVGRVERRLMSWDVVSFEKSGLRVEWKLYLADYCRNHAPRFEEIIREQLHTCKTISKPQLLKPLVFHQYFLLLIQQ